MADRPAHALLLATLICAVSTGMTTRGLSLPILRIMRDIRNRVALPVRTIWAHRDTNDIDDRELFHTLWVDVCSLPSRMLVLEFVVMTRKILFVGIGLLCNEQQLWVAFGCHLLGAGLSSYCSRSRMRRQIA